MTDFIVSGQIPGTQIQITFAIWALVIAAFITTLILRAGFRSRTLRTWIVATRVIMAIRSRTVVQS